MSKHDRSDRWIKWLLVFALVYFLGHIVHAVAQGNPAPPTIRCIPAGGGTVTCFPL